MHLVHVDIIESRTNTISTVNGKGKSKIVPVTATNIDKGSRDIAPLILKVGCRWI
jgi:hypothetical protein